MSEDADQIGKSNGVNVWLEKRGKEMRIKARRQLGTIMVVVLLSGAGAMTIPEAMAAPKLVKTSSSVSTISADEINALPVANVWSYDGFAEVGGRFDFNSPNKTTLGKFYEYRDLRPGVFGNFYFGAHRADGLFDFDVWGQNAGWDDQAYGLDLAKPGTYYLTFGWDETPHVFSKNAKTLYSGVGTNYLTIPGSVRAALGAAGPSAAANAIINANSSTIDVKYRRDTASAAARWTPNDAWDINIDYSHMHRHGTEPLGAVSFAQRGANAQRSAYELPRPVDDVTQNGNLKAEYAGTTPWGKPFNVALGGAISDYSNSEKSLTFQNPWNAVPAAAFPVNNLYGLEPDNKAQTVNVSGGVGLPFNSRYMGTFQYTWMQVDTANLPWTGNTAYGATPSFLTPNRAANTMLVNNVLHTQLTPDLKSTLRYRYYSYDTKDNLPAVVFPTWWANPDSKTGAETEEEMRYPRNFSKQNANGELVWHAIKWLTVGARYDWERWNRWAYRDALITNESTGKIFADADWGWSVLRTSLQYGERRYDNYTEPSFAGGVNDTARMRDLANRDRFKAQGSWAVDVTRMLTVTPNGGYLLDDYRTNFNFSTPTASEVGMRKAESWNAGVDVTLHVNHSVAVFASYNYEYGYRDAYLRNATPDLEYQTTDRNRTFIFGTKMVLIPATLFFDASYTVAKGTSKWVSNCTPFGCRYGPPLATFPDIHNTLQRLDTQLKYVFDDSIMRSAGFAGKAYLKLRVLWEKNSNNSWQSVQNQLGWLINPGDNTTKYSIWMGTGNPNYDVVLGQVALGLEW